MGSHTHTHTRHNCIYIYMCVCITTAHDWTEKQPDIDEPVMISVFLKRGSGTTPKRCITFTLETELTLRRNQVENLNQLETNNVANYSGYKRNANFVSGPGMDKIFLRMQQQRGISQKHKHRKKAAGPLQLPFKTFSHTSI